MRHPLLSFFSVFLLTWLTTAPAAAQSPFTLRFGVSGELADEEPLTLLADDDVVTTVYRAQFLPDLGARTGLVFARLSAADGSVRQQTGVPLPLRPNTARGLVTADRQIVVAGIDTSGAALVVRYTPAGQQTARYSLPLTRTERTSLQLDTFAGNEIVLRIIGPDAREQLRLGADLAPLSRAALPFFLDATPVSATRSLLLTYATGSQDYNVVLFDELTETAVTTSVIQNPDNLNAFGAGTFVSDPVTGALFATFLQLDVTDFTNTPVLIAVDPTDATVGDALVFPPFADADRASFDGVSPTGTLLFRLLGQDGVFGVSNFTTNQGTALPVAFYPVVNGRAVSGSVHFAPGGTPYLLGQLFRNQNDLQVLVTGTVGGSVAWSTTLGRESAVTNDRAAKLTRAASGDLYALSSSPSPDGTRRLPTVWRAGPDGGAATPVWQATVANDQFYYPVSLLARSDGRVIVIYEDATTTYTAILQPDGTPAFPLLSFDHLFIAGLTTAPNLLDLGGGVTALLRGTPDQAVIYILGTRGQVARRYFLYGGGSPIGMFQLTEGKIALTSFETSGATPFTVRQVDVNTGAHRTLASFGSAFTPPFLQLPRTGLALSGDTLLLATVRINQNGTSDEGDLRLYRIGPNGPIGDPLVLPQRSTNFSTTVQLSRNAAGDVVVLSPAYRDGVPSLRAYRVDPDNMTLIEQTDSPVPNAPATFTEQSVVGGSGGYGYLLGTFDDNGDDQLLLHGDRVDLEPTATAERQPLTGELSIYPQPTRGPQFLDVRLPAATTLTLTTLDAQGRLLPGKQRLAYGATHGHIEIASSPKAAFLRVTDAKGRSRTLPLLRFE